MQRSDSLENDPAKDGLSLYDAYMAFIQEGFSEHSEFVAAGTGALCLAEDAANALQRMEQRLGSIYRHPALVCAGDAWDLAAGRLAAAGEISLEEAREDCLVHRLFWNLFLEGKRIAIGKLNSIAASDVMIDAHLWRYFTHAQLRQAVLEEDRGGARYVGVRVYIPDKLPVTFDGLLLRREALDLRLDAAGIKTSVLRQMGRAVLELELSPSTPWTKSLSRRLRANLENQGVSAAGDDALRKSYHAVMKKIAASKPV